MSDPIVYVIDDDAPVRDSLLLFLEVQGIRAREFESAEAFLAVVRPTWAGCVLLDLRMPGMSGLELQTALAERDLRLPIIVITAHGDVPAARSALKAGAIDFLEKPLDHTALLAAIDTALERDRQQRRAHAAAATLASRMDELTPRERDVMWLVAEGRGNQEIGARLGISPRTVEIYKARMLDKLEVAGLPELLQLVRDVPRTR